MNYHDFEIEISHGAGREYPVAIARSPAGEARETMTFPFDELALKDRPQNLQIALLRSGGKRRSFLSPEEQEVQEFGRALFNALLTIELRSRYDVSQREAAQNGLGLRFKLRIQSPELAALPWEFLYDARQAEYIGLSRSTPVVRYLELPQIIQPITVAPPLRILGMMVSPNDLQPLDLENEKHRVEEATKDLQKQGLVELTWLEGKTWRDLQKAMRAGPWHIFHFIGHGAFDRNVGEGLIFLEDEDGTSHRLSATQLGRLLTDHHSLRLEMLNACEGARGSERDIFSSTGAILVRRGLPAVLAMQYEITDRAAVEFSRSFYEALAENMPVDTAVVEARKAISLAVNNTVERGTPVLYMRAPDGRVFDIESAKIETLRPKKKTSVPKETEEEKLYAKFENEGDALFGQNKYIEAKLKYANALAQKPDDSYLDERIDLCDQKIAEQKAEAERAKLYAKYKEEGDASFEQGEYEQAKSLDEQALSNKPGDQYVTKRVQACDKLIAKLVSADMALIPAGAFMMGSEDGNDDEKPVHEVYVDAFYMDKYAVTVAKYQQFLKATAHSTPKKWEDQLQSPNRPVVNVNWDDANAYAKWSSKRLPTEAEWEYAARGGLSGKKYPWGDESPDGKANFGNSYSWTWSKGAGKYLKNVDSFQANGYGLFNMAGNVWEWCEDWYDKNYYNTSPKQDPKGPDGGTFRVLRGGSWGNDPSGLRCANRNTLEVPTLRSYYIGFRCAQDVR